MKRKRIIVQTYRAEYAAERYAREIMSKFPDVRAYVVPTADFRNAVKVETADGRSALAGKRPPHYGDSI